MGKRERARARPLHDIDIGGACRKGRERLGNASSKVDMTSVMMKHTKNPGLHNYRKGRENETAQS